MHGSKYVINLPNLRLVLQVKWCVEIGYLLVRAFADQVTLTGMEERAKFWGMCVQVSECVCVLRGGSVLRILYPLFVTCNSQPF